MNLRLAVAASMLLFVPLTKGQQQMTHEEEIVRRTYARLSYAAQVNEIHSLWQEKGSRQQIDEVQFKLRMDQQLRFELTDFKVGAISEILSVKYKDLVTQPSSASGDSLGIGAGRIGGSDKDVYGNVTESSSAIAQVRWIPSHDIGENWDVSFGTIYPLTEEAGMHQRYAAFKVKVIFQGRSRTYRAMFLFGPGNGIKENVLPVDTIININGGALTRFVSEDTYPGTLIEGGLGNKDPLIHDWLKAQQTKEGAEGAVHCDPISGRCGINEQDFKKLKPIKYFQPAQRGRVRLLEAGFHPPLHTFRPMVQSGAPPTDCSGFNKSFTLPPGQLVDNEFHLDDTFHSITVAKTSSCKYTNGTSTSGNCDTACEVTTPVSPFENAGFGSLSSFCHALGTSIDNAHATATAVGDGAKCGGAGGGAVKACFACLCNVNVTVSKSGIDISISSDGFIDFKDGVDNNCPAQTQPPPGADGCDPTASTDLNVVQDMPTNCDPIVLDLKGDGFDLTNAAGGVFFDIRGTGHPFMIPWTTGADTAFLVLDRNANGTIDDGTELFSNVSPQPRSTSPNGFKALAQYDLPENGGNGDGIIDSRDAIFQSLRLWVDVNHDGISQIEELHTLPGLGVLSISLDFQRTSRKDQYGNIFLFRARVNPGQGAGVGRQAYDVFFVTK